MYLRTIRCLANYCKISYYEIKYYAKHFMEVSCMQRILVHGATNLAFEWIKTISSFHNMKIIAVIGTNGSSDVVDWTHSNNIPLDDCLEKWLHDDIDYILETTGNQNQVHLLQNKIRGSTQIISYPVLKELLPFINEWFIQIKHLELILNTIEDGLIVVNNTEHIQFLNEAASNIVGVNKEKATGQLIKDIIANSKLPDVLQNQFKEVNKKLTLAN